MLTLYLCDQTFKRSEKFYQLPERDELRSIGNSSFVQSVNKYVVVNEI